jgi:hypothetical protein
MKMPQGPRDYGWPTLNELRGNFIIVPFRRQRRQDVLEKNDRTEEQSQTEKAS